jgi:cytochrome c peroxidase
MYMVNPQNLVLEYVGLDDGARPPRIDKLPRAFGWIRVAPLRGAFATAPYLHNGSVPTLDDLFKRPADRPKTFAVGNPSQAFVYDTALPGNRNTGHAFGTELTEDEKAALVEFLKSL